MFWSNWFKMSKQLLAPLWPSIIATGFGISLISLLILVYFKFLYVGNEIWWEVPLFILLTLSVWRKR